MSMLMEHPTAADLSRYAMHDEGDNRMSAVEEHLDMGCDLCRAAVRRLRRLSGSLPRGELALAPRPGWTVPSCPAGASPWQVACSVPPLELDALVRESEAPAGVLVVGQITRSGRVYEPVRKLCVALVDANTEKTLARARTDEYGEFDLTASGNGTYGVRMGEGAGAPVVLVWDGEPPDQN